ncbi:MAG: FCD domain-containing protein [Hyphomicrobiales bacterium]
MALRPLKPIKKESVRAQVFRQLRDQVLRRNWPPGSKIPSEHELSRTMGVSRVSVREGIQRLVSLGILETRHGEGTFVRELGGKIHLNTLIPLMALDETDIFHVLEYRRIVEKGTAALAAERAGDHDVSEMEAVYQRMEQSQNSVAEFAQADLEFHLAVAKATGNSVLIKVNNVLRSVLSVSMENIVRSLGMRDGLHYHRLLIEAVRSRNAPEAERLMEEHVVRTIERLRTETAPTAPVTAAERISPPPARLEERLALHRAFWARAEQPRPLASFRIGDFFFSRHFKAALTLLEPDKPIAPEMLDVPSYLPDYERMFQESEAIGQDGFWTAEPFTGIPWMEAILGCPIRAGAESFTSRPWLSSPEEALEKVHFDLQNPWLNKYLEFTSALVRQSRGRFPVGMPIMRGPSDMIGALLGQQEMVLSFKMKDPGAMRRVIEKVTQAFLSVLQAQRRLVPDFHGGTALGFYHVWAPGPSIWWQDDLSAILSPEIYREFFLDAARLILAGHPHSAFHLHPASFFIIDELLSLEGLHVIEVNKDIGGPGVKDMLPILTKIMQTHGLILWGDLTIRDMEVIRRHLPCRGLCLHVVAPNLAEAHERRKYIANWE